MGLTESDASQIESLDQLVQQYVEQGESERLSDLLEQAPLPDIVHAIHQLPEIELAKVVAILSPQSSADLLENLPTVQAVQLIEQTPADVAATAVDLMPSDLQADLLGELDSDVAEAILRHMQPDQAQSTRRLAAYEPDQAGGLMITEFLKFSHRWTVAQVIEELQQEAERFRNFQVQYAYVCDDADRLIGVLQMRDLLLANRGTPIERLMIRNPIALLERMRLDDVHGVFQQHRFLGVPVVDGEQRLVGLVLRNDVDEALLERQDQMILRRQGIVGGEEVRSMPVFFRSKQRLIWLSLNIVLNLIAATVIAQYESTLQLVIALAVFLPIISDMSGCSGNQAVAVSIRELMLGLAKPRDVFLVLRQELAVGIINGLCLGLLLGVITWIWKGNLALSLVVGCSLTINTMVAVSIGGTIPLLLRAFGRDPAVASGPLLTTVTDMVGFFLVLSLATAFLPYLVG